MSVIGLLVLAGCAVPTSGWRDDALNRFNTAVAAGSQSYAPEETESVRQAIQSADRYLEGRRVEDADRLYQLSCQKSQILYRNLILDKVRQGSAILVDSGKDKLPVEIAIANEPVSIREAMRQADEETQKAGADEPVLKQDLSPVPIAAASAEDKTTASSIKAMPSARVPLPLVKSEPVSATAPAKQAASMQILPQPAKPPTPPITQKTARTKAKNPGINSSPELSHDPSGTIIYLTFDDGPSKLTLPIASYLKSQGIAATFFVLGNNIKGHHSTVRATVDMGHRVGNHTLSHDLKRLNASFNQEMSEVGRAATMIEKLGGDGRMVRIPFGASTKNMISRVASEGGQIFDWDINSNDSTRRGAKDHAFIEKTVLTLLGKSNKRHIIILFHDGAGHESTLTAIRNLVPLLKAKGYRFGLLSRNERVVKSEQAKVIQ